MSRRGSKRLEQPEPPRPCDRRESILEAATSLFAEQGFADADTQELADRLQVGKGTLYRHFTSKRELFLAAADRVMQQLTQRIEANIQSIADPLQRIQCGVRTFLEFFGEHPEYVELIIQERAQFKDRDKPTYLEHRERTVERWRELYRRLIKAGRVRDMSVERISDVMAATLYGAMFLNYSSGRSGAFAARAEDILDVFLHGILSDRERERLQDPDRAGTPRESGPGAGDSGKEGGVGHRTHGPPVGSE